MWVMLVLVNFCRACQVTGLKCQRSRAVAISRSSKVIFTTWNIRMRKLVDSEELDVEDRIWMVDFD